MAPGLSATGAGCALCWDFPRVDLQVVRSRQDNEQGCCALNLPVDLSAELAQRTSKPFLDMNSFSGNRSKRQHAGEAQGRGQNDRNDQTKPGSKRESPQATYHQVSP